MGTQEKEKPHRKYFYEDNGRLMVRLNYFVDRLEWQDFLSEGEKINAAYILGLIQGFAKALSGLDDLNKAIDFLYDQENVNEYSKLVDEIENLYYHMITGEENNSETFLWILSLIAGSFRGFLAQTIKSIKVKNPLD